jgi:hypothetical protein
MFVSAAAATGSRAGQASVFDGTARRGRRTSSPPQLGQTASISAVQGPQKLHS